ncbi:MAG: 1-acyl-sn-glycerol-3-phosphate acyltransferase [Verrucomicrobia bacterium]|nr:1-acyl-sn-glycerol-3-phosphate acyltransferase [Verrucomicrobiota bacterium]
MTEIQQVRRTRGMMIAQFLLGVGATLFLALPYLRRVHGLDRLQPKRRYLFVANHISLLDTIMLGALAWRSGCYPILVLGDRSVWHVSWFHKFLSSRIGFLVERGRLNPGRIRELQAFGRVGSEFHLLVFPEGTRGDGVNVAACQPGIFYIAREARLPIVPVFIENMQLISTKSGPVHPIGGLRKVEVHYGEPIEPERYLEMPREEFVEFVRQSITRVRPAQSASRSNPSPPPA